MSVAFARSLRRREVSAERMLWESVRNRALAGLKFRRQVPIGRYVVDFVCYDARLVIELDGPWHEGRFDQDRERTRIIEAQGWLVLRFPSRSVIEARADVLMQIMRHVELARGGGGEQSWVITDADDEG
jgi:very-short-patch-repair endonuclease